MKNVKVKKISKRKQLRNIEKQLPKSYRPITGWGYFWRTILYSIPVVGQIVLLINAIGAKNRNGRYFARSYFCALLVLVILAAVVVALDVLALNGSISNLVEKVATDGVEYIQRTFLK